MLKKVAQSLNESLNQLMEVLHIKRNKLVENETLAFQSILDKTTDSLQREIHVRTPPLPVILKSARNPVFAHLPRQYFPQPREQCTQLPRFEPQARNQGFNREKGGHIYLTVSDNGSGIDMARHGHKLFGMHQIFHSHPEAKGVGLFMTKTQIESMKGKISVESEVSKGTAFTVMFGA